MVMQSCDLLHGVAGSEPVLPRLLQGFGGGQQQISYRSDPPRQFTARGQPFCDDPHRQPVREHRRVVDAEAQQRRGRQPTQGNVDILSRNPASSPAKLLSTCLPQQLARHPGDGQQRHYLQQWDAQPCRVDISDGLNSQSYRIGRAVRVRLAFDPVQVLSRRAGSEAREVGGVVQVLGGDHGTGLSHREREPSQLGAEVAGPWLVVQSGAVGQERESLFGSEHVDWKSRTEGRGVDIVAGENDLTAAGRWQVRREVV
jgi:hypothetical protein